MLANFVLLFWLSTFTLYLFTCVLVYCTCYACHESYMCNVLVENPKEFQVSKDKCHVFVGELIYDYSWRVSKSTSLLRNFPTLKDSGMRVLLAFFACVFIHFRFVYLNACKKWFDLFLSGQGQNITVTKSIIKLTIIQKMI